MTEATSRLGRLGSALSSGLEPALVVALLLLSTGQLAWAQSDDAWEQRFGAILGAPESYREDGSPREKAVHAVGRLGPSVVPILVSLHQGQDHDPELRAAALVALAEVGQDDERVVSALRTALADSDERVVRTAAACLRRMWRYRVPLLAHAMRTHPSATARFYAACGLWGSENLEAIKNLIVSLGDPDPHVRAVVLWCLYCQFTRCTQSYEGEPLESIANKRKIEVLSKACAPFLVDMYDREPFVYVRRSVVVALEGRSFETMAKGVAESDSGVRGSALLSLARNYGDHPRARTLVPLVVKSLFDDSPWTRENAAGALASMRARDQAAVAALVHLAYYDPNPAVRSKVVRCLRKLLRDGEGR